MPGKMLNAAVNFYSHVNESGTDEERAAARTQREPVKMVAVVGIEDDLHVHEKLDAHRGILLGFTTREPHGNLSRERRPLAPGTVGDGEQRAPVVRRSVM